jgi:hypothetical protein
MKEVAGGSGQPAILSEFFKVHIKKSPSISSSQNQQTSNSAQSITDIEADDVLQLAKSVREPVPIKSAGKKPTQRHKSAVEKVAKPKCCRTCQKPGHNHKTCPIARTFGGEITNELWSGDKWKALVPVSNRNQPTRSTGVRSKVIAVLIRELVNPVSDNLEKQWVYIHTYSPLETNMKEAIVQASTLATWCKTGTSSKHRCYLSVDDRTSLVVTQERNIEGEMHERKCNASKRQREKDKESNQMSLDDHDSESSDDPK